MPNKLPSVGKATTLLILRHAMSRRLEHIGCHCVFSEQLAGGITERTVQL